MAVGVGAAVAVLAVGDDEVGTCVEGDAVIGAAVDGGDVVVTSVVVSVAVALNSGARK